MLTLAYEIKTIGDTHNFGGEAIGLSLTYSSLTTIFVGLALELGWLEDDGEAHLYEGGKEEDSEELKEHFKLIYIPVARSFDHFVDGEYSVG